MIDGSLLVILFLLQISKLFSMLWLPSFPMEPLGHLMCLVETHIIYWKFEKMSVEYRLSVRRLLLNSNKSRGPRWFALVCFECRAHAVKDRTVCNSTAQSTLIKKQHLRTNICKLHQGADLQSVAQNCV